MREKKVNGRKRHILVDTMGLILAVIVHSAAIQGRAGARLLFEKIQGKFPRLTLVWANGAYSGQLIEWVKNILNVTLEIARRCAG